MTPIYRYEATVNARDIDENGHLNNVEYVRWMQEAAIAHAKEIGCTEITKFFGATWVARSHHIEYLQPAFLNEKIAVLTWVVNLRKVRSKRQYKFIREHDGKVMATGITDWVFVDAQDGRPKPIPNAVADMLWQICFRLQKKNL